MAVHCFPTLLAELSTPARNTVRVATLPDLPSFAILTTPTDVRRRAYGLAGLNPPAARRQKNSRKS